MALYEFVNILKAKMAQILMWTFSGLIIAGVITFFIVTPTYSSTTKIVVNQTQNTTQSITNTDIQTNLSLINTYQSIIKEPIILESVIQNTGSNLTVEELKSKISVVTEDDSLVFGVTVTDENPNVAADLANAIANSFQQKIGEILEVESVTVLSTAVPNVDPVSPNKMLNLELGLIAGMMFGVGLAVILERTNRTVRDEKIIGLLGWTNLGSVLEMSTNEISETRINNSKPIRHLNGNKMLKRRV